MIIQTKWRLTFLFSIAIIAFSILILAVCYFYLHHSILHTLEEDLLGDGKKEFIEYYEKVPFQAFSNIDEDEILQVLDHQGQIVAQTLNSPNFKAPIHQDLLAEAMTGKDVLTVDTVAGVKHLFLYFPLSKNHVGRVSEPILQLINYERNFLKLILISLPAILLLSYLLSQYLVNQAMKPITKAFKFQENFSSNVSHELQTPLTSVKGHLEVSLRRERKAEEYKEFIETSLNEVNRVIGVLNDLYLLASSNFQKLALYHKKVDLKLQLEEILEGFSESLQAKGLQCNTAELPPLIAICDDLLIHRTLSNLIANAIKYAPENTRIQLEGVSNDQELRLSISNQCQGLVRQDLDHLFDPFYRGHNTLGNSVGGKGLGLNISNYIVTSHGGKLTASLPKPDLFQITLKLPNVAKGFFKSQRSGQH